MAIQIDMGLDADTLTRGLIGRYCDVLEVAQKIGQPGRTLWLAPTQRAVREIEHRLLEANGRIEPNGETPTTAHRALLAPNVYTFDGFAEAILEQSGQDVTPISPAFRRLLLRWIVDSALNSGKLTYFRPIAGTSGFLDLVEQYIAELKREEAWPEVFESITQSQRPRDRELTLLYRQYQDALHQRQLYDTEGRFWAAREVLAKGGWGRFQRLDVVVVDGFTDFTRTQRDLVADLDQHAAELWLTLPGESAPGRQPLFSKPLRVARLLASACTVRVKYVPDNRPPDGPGAALAHLSRELFKSPRQMTSTEKSDGVEVLASAATSGELRATAVRVKQLLRQGYHPRDIVVTTRDQSLAGRLFRFFDDSGIPVAASQTTPLANLSSIRSLVAAIDLELGDWPFDELLALLNNSRFSPAWSDWNSETSPASVGRVLRQLKVPEHRETMLESLARRLRTEDDEPLPPEYRIASNILGYLDKELARLREPHSFADWVDSTMTLARGLGIVPPLAWQASARELDRLEWTGWDLFERSLYNLSRGETMAPGQESMRFNLNQWRQVLGDVLSIETVPPQRSERGRVRVLPPEQARLVSCRAMVILGLTESSFPAPARDDCFFTDTERAELHARGLSLEPHSGRLDDEHLLFWSLVTRPRERLILSYPLVDGKGSPLSPSPFVTAARRLFTREALSDHLNERLDPLPPASEIMSRRDLRLAGTDGALSGRAALMSRLALTPAFQAAGLGIAAAMTMSTERFHQRGFSRYEGAFAEPVALERIRNAFSGDHEFSASQLERFATCPFRFVMEHGGDILPLEPPVDDANLARRGVLVHDLLQKLHAELIEGDAGEDGGPERLVPRFRELVTEFLGERPPRNDLQAALLRVERRMFEDWAEEYQSQWNQYSDLSGQLSSDRVRPHRLETAFGSAPQSGETQAPPFAALEITAESGVIRIGGRIDRIDVTQDETARRFVVIDYKSGGSRTPRHKDIEAGRQLQLALYALAIQRLELAGPRSAPLQIGFWNIAAEGFVPLKKSPRSKVQALDAAVWDGLVVLLEEVVPHLVEAMRRGEFVVENPDRNCTGACSLSRACRVAEIRALPEGLAKRRQD